MATKIIEHQWNGNYQCFPYRSFMSDGNQRDQTYDGPDKIYLQINAEGKEVYGPLTEDDIADGRPKPLDVVQWYEVDCARSDLHTLICQLRGSFLLSTRKKKIEVLVQIQTILDLQR